MQNFEIAKQTIQDIVKAKDDILKFQDELTSKKRELNKLMDQQKETFNFDRATKIKDLDSILKSAEQALIDKKAEVKEKDRRGSTLISNKFKPYMDEAIRTDKELLAELDKKNEAKEAYEQAEYKFRTLLEAKNDAVKKAFEDLGGYRTNARDIIAISFVEIDPDKMDH